MAELRPAEEMRDSNVEWIGFIPKGWKIARLKNIKAPIKNAIVDGPFGSAISTDDYIDEGVPLVRITNLVNGSVTFDEMVYISEDLAKTLSRSKTVKNDIIFAKTGATVGKCAINNTVENGVLSSSCVKITVSNEYDYRYYYYLFCTTSFVEAIVNACIGTTRNTINLQPLSNVNCIIPPLIEQQVIADYLDERCSKIDEIIAEATSSIEEYKELKQAVIFEAVTKGLDKNAPMKDSGDNWIGKIPCSWYKCRLSDVSTRIIVGLATSTTPYYRDTGVVMFRNLNIKDGWLDDSELLFLDDEFASKQAGKYINAGDVLTVHTGSNLGLSCVVPDKYDHTLSFTTLITSPDKNLIISEFLAYIINSPLGKREIEKLKVGEIKPNLNVRQFKYFTVIVPPLETQKDIVRYLDNKCELINELISEKQSLVDDLQAYKKSLIYEVVTGKRRVV